MTVSCTVCSESDELRRRRGILKDLLTFDAQLARIAVLLQKNDLCTTE